MNIIRFDRSDGLMISIRIDIISIIYIKLIIE